MKCPYIESLLYFIHESSQKQLEWWPSTVTEPSVSHSGTESTKKSVISKITKKIKKLSISPTIIKKSTKKSGITKIVGIVVMNSNPQESWISDNFVCTRFPKWTKKVYFYVKDFEKVSWVLDEIEIFYTQFDISKLCWFLNNSKSLHNKQKIVYFAKSPKRSSFIFWVLEVRQRAFKIYTTQS